LWEGEKSEILDDMTRRVQSILEATSRELEESLFDVESKSLKPLIDIKLTNAEVTITFDLPFAAKEKISLTSTEDSVSVEAKMRKPITMQMGGHLQKRVEFEKYTNKIRLPVKVDPRRARAKFRNGHLVVRFPIARRGNIVKVR